MEKVNVYSKIKNLFVQGGIEIVTPSVARTIIQPDGDVIMFINKEALENPHDLQKHLKKITRLFSSLNLFKKFFRWFITTITTAGIGYSIANIKYLHFNNTIFYALIGSGIVFFLIGVVTFRVLKLKLKKKFEIYK